AGGGVEMEGESRRPRLGCGMGGLWGPAIRPVAVRMAWQAARAVRIPVIGIGGIASAEDALEFLIAGCRAVQIGTANFVDPNLYARVRAGLEDYLRRHGLDDINRLVGTLRYPGLPAPEELGG